MQEKTKFVAAPEELLASKPLPILVVDDEAVIPRALSRLMSDLPNEILTASSGKQALDILDVNEVSVIMSDQRMPGMSGTELLQIAAETWPQSVRIMITGNNDTATAVEAINRGEVFRFVAKPWDNDSLLRTVGDALELHELRRSKAIYEAHIRAQNEELRELNEDLEKRVEERTKEVVRLYEQLDRSFDDTMKALMSTMELGNSAIVKHCQRTLHRVDRFAKVLELRDDTRKQLNRAALLHWIGLISAPETLFAKDVEDYDSDERAFWEFHPLLSQQAISHVPVLERAGQFISYYMKPWKELREELEDMPFEIDEDFVPAVQALALASTYEKRRRRPKDAQDEWNMGEEGVARVQRGRGQAFNPDISDRFVQMVQQEALGVDRLEIKIPLDRLEVGMVLARPVETKRGIPVAARGMVVTNELLERFESFNSTTGLSDIYVWQT